MRMLGHGARLGIAIFGVFASAATTLGQTAIPCDTAVTGSIDQLGQFTKHTLTFTVAEGENINVNVVDTGGTNFQTLWRLLDGSDQPAAACGTLVSAAVDCGPLPASGNPYRVEVRDYSSDGTGTYEIHVQRLTAAVACEMIDTRCDVALIAQSLPDRSDSNLHELGFTVAEGETLNVNVVDTSGTNFQTLWRLLDGLGQPAAACGTLVSAAVDCGPLPASGNPYRVEVHDYSSDGTGTYEIHVQRLTAAVACESAPACSLAARSDTALFELPFVNSGAIVTVNVVETGGANVQTLWRLLDGLGQPAANCGTLLSGVADCGPLSASGNPYRVEIRDYSHDGTGTMSVFANGVSLCCGNGVVDVAEPCDDTAPPGPSPCCTAQCNFASAATVCRASGGACDAAESCSGSAGTCPADEVSPAGTICRAAAAPCDAAETCDGVAASCPAAGVASSNTVCRSAAGVCDVAETCTGASASCPPDAKVPSGTTCRAAAGACDVAETCDGTSASCPNDTFISTATVCRSAAGTCDVAEHCTGTSAPCPADVFAASTTVCRPTTGICDLAETCTGASAPCPGDGFASSSTVCRSAAGPCDVAEACTGSSASCPADLLKSAGTVCRSAAGACDATELCSGLGVPCPSDVPAADGSPCDDGLFCTTADQCSTGTCGGSVRVCDDGDACSTDACDEVLDRCTVTSTPCDDGNPCTADACGAGDSCTHTARAGESCDAGACRSDALCQSDGTCGGGTPKDCSALDDPCSKGVCDAGTGECVAQPVDGAPACTEACLLPPDAETCPACNLACGADPCLTETTDPCTLEVPTAGPPPKTVIVVTGEPGAKCKVRVVSSGQAAADRRPAVLRAKSARVRGGSAEKKIPPNGRLELRTTFKLNRVARKLLDGGGSIDARVEVTVHRKGTPKQLLKRLLTLVES